MKVKKVTLLLIVCIVWMAAVFNIFRIGLIEYPPYLSIFNLCLSIIVFTVFQYFIFGKLVKRHTKRILNYKKDYQFFLKFFDLKSFAIMAFMMTAGIYLRVSGLCPVRFIAVFYSGLGLSLLLAGILFGWNYFKNIRQQ